MLLRLITCFFLFSAVTWSEDRDDIELMGRLENAIANGEDEAAIAACQRVMAESERLWKAYASTQFDSNSAIFHLGTTLMKKAAWLQPGLRRRWSAVSLYSLWKGDSQKFPKDFIELAEKLADPIAAMLRT